MAGGVESGLFTRIGTSGSVQVTAFDDGGGIFGLFGVNASAVLRDSYSTANVYGYNGVSKLGGLVGETWGGAYIQKSYSSGTVGPDGEVFVTYVGGLVGQCNTHSSGGGFSESFSVSPVSGLSNVGGLIGGCNGGGFGDLSTDYYDTELSGVQVCIAEENQLNCHTGSGSDWQGTKANAPLTGWNFLDFDAWKIVNNSYPVLNDIFSVEFVSPTPENDTTITPDDSVPILVESSADDNSSTIINWNNSLLDWWRFSMGGDVFSFVGAGDELTMSESGAEWTPDGKFGGAYNFSSGGNLSTANESLSFAAGAPYTISGWFKPTGNTNNLALQFGEYGELPPSSCAGFLYVPGDGTPSFVLKQNLFDEEVAVTSDVPTTISEWSHIVVVSDGSFLKIYVNGTHIATQVLGNFSGYNFNPYLEIGANQAGSEHFDGGIDDLQIYNRALSNDEIEALYDSYINRDGRLVALYGFEGNAGDYSGHGNAGTVNDAEWTSAGKFGGAYHFNGVDQNISIPNVNRSNLTFSAWIKKDANDSAGAFIAGPAGDYGVGIYSNGKVFMTQVGTTDVSSYSTITDTEWHHVAVTMDDYNTCFYIDGVNRDGDCAELSFNSEASGDYMIGGGNGLGYFAGTLDDVRIYNGALNADEIDAVAHNGNIGGYYNKFSGLTDGIYTYQAYNQSPNGSINSTESRTLTVEASEPPPTETHTNGVYVETVGEVMDRGAYLKITPDDPTDVNYFDIQYRVQGSSYWNTGLQNIYSSHMISVQAGCGEGESGSQCMTPGTTYEFRGKIRRGETWEGWSDIETFTTTGEAPEDVYLSERYMYHYGNGEERDAAAEAAEEDGHTLDYDAFGWLQPALNQVASGGTVHVAANSEGNYYADFFANHIEKPVMIIGPGTYNKDNVFDGSGAVFNYAGGGMPDILTIYNSNVTIQDLVLADLGEGAGGQTIVNFGETETPYENINIVHNLIIGGNIGINLNQYVSSTYIFANEITGNTDGIYVDRALPEDENLFIQNTGYDFFHNKLHDNSHSSVHVEDNQWLDLSYNWWGNSNGPFVEDNSLDMRMPLIFIRPFCTNEDCSNISKAEMSVEDFSQPLIFIFGTFRFPLDELNEGNDNIPYADIAEDLTISVPVSDSGTTTISVPTGVRIKKAGEGDFPIFSLGVENMALDSLTGFSSGSLVGALQWGVPSLGLEFVDNEDNPNPITIDMYVGTDLVGKTLNLQRSESTSEGWTTEGLIGVNGAEDGTCLVSEAGICSFQTWLASYFAATETVTPTPPTSNRGGGGGISYILPKALTPATKLDFTINNTNPISTDSNLLNLTFNADPKTVSGYVVSLDKTFSKDSVRNYTTSTTFTLPANITGLYTLYVRYYSPTGNMSDIISHTISYVPGTSTTPVITTPTPPISTPVTTANNKYQFTRLLKQGMTGEDIKQLQIWLNTHGFTINPTGPGSLGNETTYFGPATKKALILMQKQYKLAPYPGHVGPATRGVLNAS